MQKREVTQERKMTGLKYGLAKFSGAAIVFGLLVIFQEYFKVPAKFVIFRISLVIFSFVAGIGVVLKKNWGRISYLLFALSLILFIVLKSFQKIEPLDFSLGILYAIFCFISIWFFTKSEVKKQFK